MNARNLESRIVKLETRKRRSDEMLLVWRMPTESEEQALTKAQFDPGDRVICVEWLNTGSPPPPRWYTDMHMGEMRRTAPPLHEAINKACTKCANEAPEEPRMAAEKQTRQQRMLMSKTDAELLYGIFGVLA